MRSATSWKKKLTDSNGVMLSWGSGIVAMEPFFAGVPAVHAPLTAFEPRAPGLSEGPPAEAGVASPRPGRRRRGPTWPRRNSGGAPRELRRCTQPRPFRGGGHDRLRHPREGRLPARGHLPRGRPRRDGGWALRRAARRPGTAAIHARRARVDVPRPDVDDAPVRRLRHRRRVERALPVPAVAGPDRAVGLSLIHISE